MASNQPKKAELVQNDEMTLSCLVSGYPSPTIQWTFNSKQIQNTSKMMIKTGKMNEMEIFSHLVLKKFSSEHVGAYRCVAQSAAGSAQKTFIRQLQGM